MPKFYLITIKNTIPRSKIFPTKTVAKKEERGGGTSYRINYYSCKDIIKYKIIIPRSKISRGIENNIIPFSKIFPTKNIAKRKE